MALGIRGPLLPTRVGVPSLPGGGGGGWEGMGRACQRGEGRLAAGPAFTGDPDQGSSCVDTYCHVLRLLSQVKAGDDLVLPLAHFLPHGFPWSHDAGTTIPQKAPAV